MRLTLTVKFQTFEAVIEDDALNDDSKSALHDMLAFLHSLDSMWRDEIGASSKQDTKKQPNSSEGVVVELAHVMVDGNGTMRACGGDYSKYGVPIYSDSVEIASEMTTWMDRIAKKAGRHTPPFDAYFLVELKEGKPKRVLRIWCDDGEADTSQKPAK